jgi:uncharacterized RDD family membrane protein YckC
MGCAFHPAVETGLERCERCGGTFCPDCYVVLRDAPFCAGCKVDYVRDLRSGIVPHALDLASIGRRFGGLWIDGVLTTLAVYAVLIPLMFAAGAASAGARPRGQADPIMTVVALLMYPLIFGVPLVYEGLMLQRRGQTLGKIALGVKVVTPEGSAISTAQAWGRAALKVVLGSCLGVDYLPALVTRERTCLHDMIAKTRVVRVQR